MPSWRQVNNQFGVIYADPPWHFKNFSEKGTGRNAVAHYDCLDFEQLKRIDVGAWAARDCVLFLWATDPLLPKALELIEAWGFRYKTVGFYWVKTNRRVDLNALGPDDFFTGLGYWTRANAEQCLLATRGNPPRLAKDVRRLIVEPRREHSRKPEQIYERIERLARGPYLEVFARQTRPGWRAWGDQVGLFDAGSVATRRRPSDMSKGAATPTIAPETTSLADQQGSAGRRRAFG
jgi:N6-adenosine-specific RNA methylase IME4